MGTEVDWAGGERGGNGTDAQPAHDTICNDVREKTRKGGKRRIKAKHQLLKIAALSGIYYTFKQLFS